MGKGKSSAVLNAMKILKKYPNITAAKLAEMAAIDPSTVFRADWWKTRPAAQPQTGEKQ